MPQRHRDTEKKKMKFMRKVIGSFLFSVSLRLGG
jgi:hypothetical protein